MTKFNNKNVTVDMIARAQSGDKQARDAACMGLYKLVSKIAHKIAASYGMDPADLTSEGMIGALEGIDKFDVDRGIMPTTFIVWHIKRRVMGFARLNCQIVRGPQDTGAQKVHYQARRMRAKIKAQQGACDTIDLAKALGVPVATVAKVERTSQPSASLSAMGPDGQTLMATLADNKPTPAENVSQAQFQAWVMGALAEFREGLNERDQYIFDSRIARAEPIPGKEVGAALGMTRQGVSVHEIKIRAKLDKRLNRLQKS